MNEIQKSKFGDLDKYLITSRTQAEPVEPLIYIENTIYATKGGISLLTGVQKSGKTTAIKIMIETAFMQQVYDGYDNLGICSVVKNDKSVIYINTEMTNSDMVAFRDKICKNLQLPELPHNLHLFHFLTPSPKERIKLLDQVLERSKDAHLVFIDGLADLVHSVNDEAECNLIIQFLQNLASNYNVAIIGVIHENRGNKNSRGHLGQQAERKCIASVSVSKNKAKKFFAITSSLNRHSEDFEDINYHYNEHSRLERIDSTNEKVKSSNELSESIELARIMFDNDETLTDKELKGRLKNHFIPTIESDTKNGKDNAARNKAQRTVTKWLASIMKITGEGKYKLFDNLENL
ncbi:AAA family ATPase [Emticicia sp.]|uniref:AAA family ATPase n=1 Tax=Emticicia sp. TaxID=1930953 RepID=UPI0037533087